MNPLKGLQYTWGFVPIDFEEALKNCPLCKIGKEHTFIEHMEYYMKFLKTKDEGKNRLLLIGGFPKGYDIPFHKNTLSGKRLLKLKEKYNLIMEFTDLWETEQQEKDGIITINKLGEIYEAQKTHRVIALGWHVYDSLKKAEKNVKISCPELENTQLVFEYLPHPASRRTADLITLEEGLIKKCH